MNLRKKNILLILLVALFTLTFTAFGSNASSGAALKPELKYRRLPTATSDLLEGGVVPILEKQGYKLKAIEITDSIQRELALNEDEIDFHVDAHKAYIANINKAQKTDLAVVIPLPTAPAGIYPGAKSDLSKIAKGDKIALPNDPSNTARSLLLLSQLGWLKLKPEVNSTQYQLSDIIENTYNLDIIELKGANIVPTRTDFAFIILRASDAYNSGVDFNTALIGETPENILPDNYIHLTVSAKHKDEQWVKDIVAAYQSEDFKNYIKTQSKIWILPDYLK
jgi:D-methionine transport system substrate-binding protein